MVSLFVMLVGERFRPSSLKAHHCPDMRFRETSTPLTMMASEIGAGTALDALRLDLPIIMVPNPALLDNHQAELAEELQRQGYAIYGKLG